MVDEELRVLHVYVAQLPLLPEPLRLRHGPLLVAIEKWSDGTTVASVPALAEYAQSDKGDTWAMKELGENLLESAGAIVRLLLSHEKLGGPTEWLWENFKELIDVTELIEQVRIKTEEE